jgi:hypothetical protein
LSEAERMRVIQIIADLVGDSAFVNFHVEVLS